MLLLIDTSGLLLMVVSSMKSSQFNFTRYSSIPIYSLTLSSSVYSLPVVYILLLVFIPLVLFILKSHSAYVYVIPKPNDIGSHCTKLVSKTVG